MTTTQEFHFCKGEELIADDITEIDGIKVDPERKYRVPMPVNIARNHFRRLKRAFIKKGAPGVARYILSVNKIMETQDA
jgi:hypothetical protein